jgi:quercetin dioxygenase-like cupin family protein
MSEPILSFGSGQPISASGQSFEIYEWTGSGPDYMHVHYHDDEAWHVLEGTLTFRFSNRQVQAHAGTTVFVPAGVPHSYFNPHGTARYLIILTPRLHELISALHSAPCAQHNEIMRRFDSEILD